MTSLQKVIIVLVISTLVCLGIYFTKKRFQLLLPIEANLSAFYDRIAFETGDLLLWSYSWGRLCDVSKIISGSAFTHVSIVFKHPKTSKLYSWESIGKYGFRLVSLESELLNPRYHCFVRHLQPNHINCRDFMQFMDNMKGGAYAFNLWECLLGRWIPLIAIPRPKEKNEDTAPRFCSELVAYTYSKLGIMNFSLSSKSQNHVLPSDFAEPNHKLPFKYPYSFGPLIRIKYRKV